MEQPIEVVLGGTPLSGPFQYSAVLGGEKFSSFEKRLHKYLDVGFTDFNFEVIGDLEADRERVAALKAAGMPGLCVRLDATIAGPAWTRPADIFKAYMAPSPHWKSRCGSAITRDVGHFPDTVACRLFWTRVS